MHFREPATEPVFFQDAPVGLCGGMTDRAGRAGTFPTPETKACGTESQGTVPAPAPASLIYGAPLPDPALSRRVERSGYSPLLSISQSRHSHQAQFATHFQLTLTLDLRHFGYTLFCEWMAPGSLSFKQSTVLPNSICVECSGPVSSMINSTVLQGHLCKALGAADSKLRGSQDLCWIHLGGSFERQFY